MVVLPLLLAVVLPAPVAQARNAPATAASPSPTGPCLLHVLLCGQNIVQNPAPCVLGLLCTPAPLPSVCVGGALLCGGGILTNPTVTPSSSSTPVGTNPRPTANPVAANGPGGGTGTVPAAGQGPLLAPPGIGLVTRPDIAIASSATDGPNPDPLAVLLSLSIRDGLAGGSFSIWPWLLALQLLLFLVMLAIRCSRQLTAASKPTS